MSDNRYYVKYDTWPTPVGIDGVQLGLFRDEFDSARPRVATGEQFDHAAIECGKSSLLVERQTEKISIGDLLVADQTVLKVPNRVPQRNIIGPELMRGMANIGDQQAQCFQWRGGLSRKRPIRDDPDESSLSERARRPARSVIPCEPGLCATVAGMTLPAKRDQDVYIEQERSHSISDSSSLTRSEVIPESRGTSKTMSPFTMRVGVGARRPLRTSSETALPKAKERLRA
jgi:hypothetical protein